mmetsp:Transcript_30838/g.94522  ORF Transcript_30838/g.94522 Transcript_30838/m.94522 type:complete len:241 (-) Transcript_30838:467-1189(-)
MHGTWKATFAMRPPQQLAAALWAASRLAIALIRRTAPRCRLNSNTLQGCPMWVATQQRIFVLYGPATPTTNAGIMMTHQRPSPTGRRHIAVRVDVRTAVARCRRCTIQLGKRCSQHTDATRNAAYQGLDYRCASGRLGTTATRNLSQGSSVSLAGPVTSPALLPQLPAPRQLILAGRSLSPSRHRLARLLEEPLSPSRDHRLEPMTRHFPRFQCVAWLRRTCIPLMRAASKFSWRPPRRF